MKLRHKLLCTARAASMLACLPASMALAAGNVKLQFNNNSQKIALSQIAPAATNGINFFPNASQHYLSMRLADPLLCAEFPSSTNGHVRFRLVDANGDIVANNNSSGALNTFGSLTPITGNSGGIRYFLDGTGAQVLNLNTTADLVCYTYSTFVSPNQVVLDANKAGRIGTAQATVEPGLSYSITPITGNVVAKGAPGDQVFADGFESPFVAPMDVVTTLTAPATVRADVAYVYSINVRNSGAVGAVSGVVVRDFFYKASSTSSTTAALFQNGTWTCSAGPGGNCGGSNNGTGVIYAPNVSLQPNGEVTFTATRSFATNPAAGTNFSVAAAAFTNPNAGEASLSNNSVSATGMIVVTQPPAITGLPTTTQTFLEDGSAGPFNFTISDPDTNLNSVVVTAASNNTGLVTNAGAVIGGTGANRNLSITPVANANGNVAITVTANDGTGNTATRVVNFAVTAVNDAPSINFRSNCTASNGGTWNAGGSPAEFLYSAGSQNTQTCGSFIVPTMGPPDEAGQQIEAIEIVDNSNPALFAEQPALDLKNILVFRPNGNSGTADLQIRMRDSGGTANGGVNTSAIKILRIRVLGATPTMSSIAPQSILEDGATGTIGFTVADTDTATNLLVVTASSSNPALIPNANVVLGGSDGNRTVSITPLADQFGSADITLTVSDGAQQSQQTFAVNVAPVNDAPSFTHQGDQLLPSGAASGLRTVSGWASNISVGPANESNQVIDGFFVEVLDQSPANFLSGQPQVFSSGNLRFSLTNAGSSTAFDGHACLRITLFDDGPGDPPDVHESEPVMIKLQVGPGSVDCELLRASKKVARK